MGAVDSVAINGNLMGTFSDAYAKQERGGNPTSSPHSKTPESETSTTPNPVPNLSVEILKGKSRGIADTEALNPTVSPPPRNKMEQEVELSVAPVSAAPKSDLPEINAKPAIHYVDASLGKPTWIAQNLPVLNNALTRGKYLALLAPPFVGGMVGATAGLCGSLLSLGIDFPTDASSFNKAMKLLSHGDIPTAAVIGGAFLVGVIATAILQNNSALVKVRAEGRSLYRRRPSTTPAQSILSDEARRVILEATLEPGKHVGDLQFSNELVAKVIRGECSGVKKFEVVYSDKNDNSIHHHFVMSASGAIDWAAVYNEAVPQSKSAPGFVFFKDPSKAFARLDSELRKLSPGAVR